MSMGDVLIAALCAAMCLAPLVLAVVLSKPHRCLLERGRKSSGGTPERIPPDLFHRRSP